MCHLHRVAHDDVVILSMQLVNISNFRIFLWMLKCKIFRPSLQGLADGQNTMSQKNSWAKNKLKLLKWRKFTENSGSIGAKLGV